MVSGLVVAVTFIIIYRQLKAQAAANAFQRIETVHRRWVSTELVLARLEVALQLRDGTLDVADDTRPDAILGFFELVRDLNRQGYLDDEEIAGARRQPWSGRISRARHPSPERARGRPREVERPRGARQAMVRRFDRKHSVTARWSSTWCTESFSRPSST